jgi:hypothetical protein
MSVGIVTTTELHVGVDTGFFTEELVVNGDARITGIITVGRSSITIDGTNDRLVVGNTVIGQTDANYSGIVTAGSIVADSATFSGSISVGGTITYDDVTYLDSIGIATARSGLEIGAGSITTLQFVGSATATTSSTSQTNIDTFTASEFRSGQYQIQVTKGSAYHITTLNLVHDGTNVFLSEFGTIKTTSDSLASFDADINSGNVRVRATPSSSDSTVFKISKTLIKV